MFWKFKRAVIETVLLSAFNIIVFWSRNKKNNFQLLSLFFVYYVHDVYTYNIQYIMAKNHGITGSSHENP